MQLLAARTHFQQSASPRRQHIACVAVGQQVSAHLKEYSAPINLPPTRLRRRRRTSGRLTERRPRRYDSLRQALGALAALATPRLPICTSAADVSVTPSSGSPRGAVTPPANTADH